MESLGDVENAIRLCSRCHDNYDDLQCPGMTFFPQDLNFFIDFEIDDYDRRVEKASSNGSTRRRKCPTRAEYLAAQIKKGAVPKDAIGGLYDRYYLYDYLARRGPGPTVELETPAPRQWHGSPIAAICRAALVSGGFATNLAVIPQEQRDKLRKLQDLYLRPDPITASKQENSGNGKPGQQATALSRTEDAAGHHHTTTLSNSLGFSAGMQRSKSTNGMNLNGSSGPGVNEADYQSVEEHNVQATEKENIPPMEESRSHIMDSAVNRSSRKRPYTEQEDNEPSKKHISKLAIDDIGCWGPESSSNNKAKWYPRMMGWDREWRESPERKALLRSSEH